MDKISIEEVGEGKDELPVLSFTDYDKGLVLNKTNTKKIASIHGTETQISGILRSYKYKKN